MNELRQAAMSCLDQCGRHPIRSLRSLRSVHVPGGNKIRLARNWSASHRSGRKNTKVKLPLHGQTDSFQRYRIENHQMQNEGEVARYSILNSGFVRPVRQLLTDPGRSPLPNKLPSSEISGQHPMHAYSASCSLHPGCLEGRCFTNTRRQMRGCIGDDSTVGQVFIR